LAAFFITFLASINPFRLSAAFFCASSSFCRSSSLLLSSPSEPLSSSSSELLSPAPDFVPTARELLALLPRDLPLKPASLLELSPLSLATTSKVAARDTLDPSPCATRPGLAALVLLALLSSLGLLFLA
jgi:hypothetical protein